MIFLINSSYTLWIPMYMFNGAEYQSSYLIVLLCFELLLSIFCVLHAIRLCIVIWKIRVFHVNMSILSIAYSMQYLECILGKWMMMGHQFGFVSVDGVALDQTYKHVWTDDVTQIPNITNINDILPVLIGGCLIWHYLFSMTFFIVSFCVERALATFLSEDYEKHHRAYISLIILMFSHFVSLYLSYRCFFEELDFKTTIIGAVCCVATSCVIFVAILIINQKISHQHSKTGNNGFYTLGFRFQVKENIRALKLIYRVLVSIVGFIIVICIMLFIIVFDVFPPINIYLVFLVENCLYLNPLFICSIIFYYIEPWKNALKKILIFPSLYTRIFSSESRHMEASNSKIKPMDCKQTTDLYFKQLENAW